MSIETIRRIDQLEKQLGGRFALTALLQKRIQEVIRGSPRFIEEQNPIRSAIAEVEAGKIELVEPAEDDPAL